MPLATSQPPSGNGKFVMRSCVQCSRLPGIFSLSGMELLGHSGSSNRKQISVVNAACVLLRNPFGTNSDMSDMSIIGPDCVKTPRRLQPSAPWHPQPGVTSEVARSIDGGDRYQARMTSIRDPVPRSFITRFRLSAGICRLISVRTVCRPGPASHATYEEPARIAQSCIYSTTGWSDAL